MRSIIALTVPALGALTALAAPTTSTSEVQPSELLGYDCAGHPGATCKDVKALPASSSSHEARSAAGSGEWSHGRIVARYAEFEASIGRLHGQVKDILARGKESCRDPGAWDGLREGLDQLGRQANDFGHYVFNAPQYKYFNHHEEQQIADVQGKVSPVGSPALATS
jgi:hypothetical protein